MPRLCTLLLSTLALVAVLLGVTSAHAQDAEVTNTVTPPPSEYVVSGGEGGSRSRLELVRDDDARGPTDISVVTSAGLYACHVPCSLDVPSGVVELRAEGLEQRFELQLPVARFRVRAGDAVPWLESSGGMAAGLGLGAVGLYVALTSTKDTEIAGGIALVALGAAFFGLSLALLIVAVANEHGSAELDTFETALREGVLRF
ncbi:MAG: hypothetical protein J0L92_00530 [Deltaproteobacteria bacterium]|nr:hypothetical protein [Deltaproteobacteria bacterium]